MVAHTNVYIIKIHTKMYVWEKYGPLLGEKMSPKNAIVKE